jgi:type 1 glutamine amidotransferase
MTSHEEERKMKTMRAVGFALVITFFTLLGRGADLPSVLVYTHNSTMMLDGKKAYIHDNIAECVKAIEKIGADNYFKVVHSDDPGVFTNVNLKSYKAIIFANSNNKAFDNEAERKAFQDYIHHGGGFVGIHSASGSERDWPWFWQLLGASFGWHPPLQKFTVHIKDKNHPATRFFNGDTWDWEDEFYVMKEQPKNVHVLLEADIKSLKNVDPKKLQELIAAKEAEARKPIEVGDMLHVSFSDTPTLIPAVDDKVKGDGTITLMYNQVFQATNKTSRDLEKEIRKRYVPDFFARVSVAVERNSAGESIHVGRAGNFTDFSAGPKANPASKTAGDNSLMLPLAWYHEFEGARSFYTALGHKKEYYSDPVFVKHLTGGILWAAGLPQNPVLRERRPPNPNSDAPGVKS